MIPKSPLRGALLQMISGEDFDENLQQVFNLLEQIPDPSLLDVIFLPENAFFFRIGEALQALTLDDSRWAPLQAYVDKYQISLVVGGTPLQEEGVSYNATLLFEGGRPAQVIYRKIHLFDVDVEGSRPMRESDQFGHGTKPEILTIGEWKIGLSICYDLRFSELYHHYSVEGVHALFVPAAFLVPTGRAHWHTLLKARAIEAQSYVLAPAQAGSHRLGNRERVTYGHSLVVEPWGTISEEGDGDSLQVLMFELDPMRLSYVRKQIPISEHRRL